MGSEPKVNPGLLSDLALYSMFPPLLLEYDTGHIDGVISRRDQSNSTVVESVVLITVSS